FPLRSPLNLPLTCFESREKSGYEVLAPSHPSLKPISPSLCVCAKWGPCTLPPVHPLHCGPSRLLFEDHLFFLRLRGEARGLAPPNPIPTKALE
ncbi:hypothetical protein KUCAC02_033813, partial [Chaenocephalus aceratus]